MFKLFLYLIIIFSSVFHEFMHGWTAYRLGDSTAKNAGRLTLNPFKHMELMGTVIIPLFLLYSFGGFIGWAKPVPYNPYLLKDKRFGSSKVALAGPAANIFLAVIFGLALRLISSQELLYAALTWIVYINIVLAIFNLIPIPPLDGSKLIMDFFPRIASILTSLSYAGIFLAIIVYFYIAGPIASLIYFLVTGQSFKFLVF